MPDLEHVIQKFNAKTHINKHIVFEMNDLPNRIAVLNNLSPKFFVIFNF